jgi:hypothetical protein
VNRSPAPKTSVRLPADVTRFLQQKAAHHVTSMTAEIVRLVRAEVAREMHRQTDAGERAAAHREWGATPDGGKAPRPRRCD